MQSNASQLYRFTFVLLIALALIAAFLFVVRAFLLDILMAAIFSGMIYPVLERCRPLFGKRRGLATAIIVVVAVLSVALPIFIVIAIVGSETIQLSEKTVVWVRQSIEHPEPLLAQVPHWLANAPWLAPAIASVKSHVAEIVTATSGFLSRRISSITHLTIFFLLDVFVTLFALVYFLHRGPALVAHFIERIPVAASEARAIVHRTLTTTAAALKGIIVVGTAQGLLIGSAFAIVGFGQPWFWGTIAALASTVPGLGSGLVWIPAAIYLFVTGKIAAGIGLIVWGALVVGIADNLLRVYIVGRGAALPSFIVFVSTLGGLTTFGPAGILVGPVLVGVLIGVLDLYQAVLKSSGLSTAPDGSR